MFAEEEIVKSHRLRATGLGNIVLIAFGIILSRLWYLQIYHGQLYLEYSLKNRLRKEIIRAPRGMLYDRNGVLLVNNVPRFDATITPQYIKNKKLTFKRLANILDMKAQSIYKIMAKNSTLPRYKSIVIKKNISRREVAIIETENDQLPGVSVDTFISREYIDKEVGAHVFGYISEINSGQLPKFKKSSAFDYKQGDFIGQFGLEEKWDLNLRGTNGFEFVEVDALGRKKRHIGNDNLFKGIEGLPSRPGKNANLSIDRRMQLAAYEALGDWVGSVVAVKVDTGEVLAMVSKPSFDPSQFSRGLTSEYWNSLVSNDKNPLRDRTVQEHYSPGSTFKLVTAITALEEGIIDPQTELFCNGSLTLGRKTYHCWRKLGHGKVNMTKAIQQSCNIYFQKLAKKMDIDVLAKYAQMLGFGTKTEVGLPREVSGLIPTKEWKFKRNGVPWQLGETLSCAIGQSYILASPLQLAMAYSVIANGGTLYRPYIVKRISSNTGKGDEVFNPEVVRHVQFKPSTIDTIKNGLFAVVNRPGGTAYGSRGSGIRMAGKTGTSQVIRMSKEKLFAKCEKNPYKIRNHGVFVAYLPANDPKIAVSVVIEHGCHGASSAAPIAKKVGEVYMKHYQSQLQQKIFDIEKKERALHLAIQQKIKEEEEEDW